MKTHKTPLRAVAHCFLAAQGWLSASPPHPPLPRHWPQPRPLPFLQLSGLNIRGSPGAGSWLGLNNKEGRHYGPWDSQCVQRGGGREGTPQGQAITGLQEVRTFQDSEYTGVTHRVSSRPTQEAAAIWKSPFHVQPVPIGTWDPVSPSKMPWPGTFLQMSRPRGSRLYSSGLRECER